VKEAIFTSLAAFEGAVVFDLFAGSGALGLEALSRGAAEVVWVERNPRHASLIRRNLALVQRALPDASSFACEIVAGDASKIADLRANYAGKIDVIFADPPYHAGRYESGAVELCMDTGFAGWARGAILVLEHARDVALPLANIPWKLLKDKAYGETVVTYLKTEN